MVVTRFAPSPTGYLHLGHAFSALSAFRSANGGTFFLRIEDIDSSRCKPEFTDAILEDLAWLGLDWPKPARRQSEHMADYAAALDKLKEMGLVYPCFCTRREIERDALRSGLAPHPEDGTVIYPGTCRALSKDERAARLASGEPATWRLDVEAAAKQAGPLSWVDRSRGKVEALPQIFGDVVLARKDVPASYHLSVTVDDALQGVSLVTRGEDLFSSTHVHRLLQALLGYDTPEYHHHRLLTDSSGKRYAKRDRSATLRDLRAEGKTPEDIVKMLF
ncbi:MAG: tRNA glutamyl-Q(34) synthetase GluQRS [Alphaproteobacteria bacterium]|nr:tRNA glutamyl-Q(34) synthetase GluQRS [Alphaproteobacteria bacterium]